ncbi:13546_t:CDS:2, partial [Acaulospora colombiana]
AHIRRYEMETLVDLSKWITGEVPEFVPFLKPDLAPKSAIKNDEKVSDEEMTNLTKKQFKLHYYTMANASNNKKMPMYQNIRSKSDVMHNLLASTPEIPVARLQTNLEDTRRKAYFNDLSIHNGIG